MFTTAFTDRFVWILPSTLEVMYTIVFGLFVVCVVIPPLEFVAAGITLENAFAKLLGSENTNFVEFHLRRTALLRIVCSQFVLYYYFTMCYLSDEVLNNSPNLKPPFTSWDLILWLGIGVATFVSAHTYLIWYNFGTWSRHPTVLTLQKLWETNETATTTSGLPNTSHEERWRRLASNINAEYRNPDKFVAGQGGIGNNWPGRRFVVTESWILDSRFTCFRVIKQSSENLTAILVSSTSVLDPGSLTEGGRPAGESLGTQMVVTVRFVDLQTGVCLLTCGLPASNLDSLRAKLQCPLVKARGVELEPTIVQRFVHAFTNVVDETDPVFPDSDLELEQCIGCMAQMANVMLIQRCVPDDAATFAGNELDASARQDVRCGHCHCRPMWCLDCMARWFASRQTEAHRPPSVWLSGRVPCPTCRAIFCVRDVVRLDTTQLSRT